jgi:glucosyl-dolichyl phosphate glucuronosyltransferase
MPLARWNDNRELIDSLPQHTLPPKEIIFVSDHNDDLLTRAKAEFADVMVIANVETRGLSGARNTGIAASTAALLLFLDDDAIADPAWLAQLARACAAADVLGATGTINPLWIGSRPDWFPEEFMWTIGCTYRGLPQGAATIRNLMGASMALKRSVFDRVGAFNRVFGRESNLVSCEETELCIRAQAAFPTARFVLVPAAIIQHKVPASRLTWRYFAARCHAEGLSKAYVAAAVAQGALHVERDYVLRTLTTGILQGIGDSLRQVRLCGIKRSAAIVFGLSCTIVGFAQGRRRGSPKLRIGSTVAPG